MSLIRELAPELAMGFGDFRRGAIHNGPGVYIVRCNYRGRPRHLKRLNRTDAEGILCIGRAMNLRARVGAFYRDIQKEGLKVHFHSEGWTYRKYFRDNPSPTAMRIEPNDMEVLWKPLPTHREADIRETELIQSYVMKFQDKPPLNISIRRQRL